MAKKKLIQSGESVASHAGVFRGARILPSPQTRAPLKTPAWEARESAELQGVPFLLLRNANNSNETNEITTRNTYKAG